MSVHEDRVRQVLEQAGRSAPATATALDEALRRGRAIRRRRRLVARVSVAGVVAVIGVAGVVGVMQAQRGDGPRVIVPATEPSSPRVDASVTAVSAPSTTPSATVPRSTTTESPPPPVPAAPPTVVGVHRDGSLVTIDPLTGVETAFGNLSFVPGHIEVTADGQTIYAARPRGAGNTFEGLDVVQRAADGTETVVATSVTAFTLSPDDQSLAFVTWTSIDPQNPISPVIIERNLGSGAERTWIHTAYQLDTLADLSYSPDGSKIAYTAVWENRAVYVFARDSSGPGDRPIIVDEGVASAHDSFGGVTWADNDKLVVVASCCYAESTLPTELLTITLDGKVVNRLAGTNATRVDIDLKSGWWIIHDITGTGNTAVEQVALRAPDGTMRDYPTLVDATF